MEFYSYLKLYMVILIFAGVSIFARFNRHSKLAVGQNLLRYLLAKDITHRIKLCIYISKTHTSQCSGKLSISPVRFIKRRYGPIKRYFCPSNDIDAYI